MKKKIISIIIILIFICLIGINFAQAISLVPEECAEKYASNCSLCSFIELFINAADIILGLAGTLALVMFIFGGFVMITAYGKASRVQWGKDILIATVIGILIILLAWTLVNLIILSLYGGTDLGVFTRITGKSEWSGVCANTPSQ